MASARYHEHMNAAGGTDDHFEPELDAYQALGVIPARVLGRLWPGFASQDYEVSINPVYVRRHMQKAPEYMQRVASFAQHAPELPGLFARATAFARYDSVKEGEAGLTVYAPVDAGDGSTQYLAIGVKLYTASQGRGKPNHVTTVIPPINEKRLRTVLARREHCVHPGGDASPGSGSD